MFENDFCGILLVHSYLHRTLLGQCLLKKTFVVFPFTPTATMAVSACRIRVMGDEFEEWMLSVPEEKWWRF